MISNYNNFGINNTVIGTPDSNYNGFGVVNSSQSGLSTIPNIVTQSVSPSAFSGGTVRSTMQSPNYILNTSGWIIRPDGYAEFSSGSFRGTITAGTFVGATFKTVSTLPVTGTGIYIDGTTGVITFYNTDNPVVGINDTGIFFNTPLGVGSGSLQGETTNEVILTVAGSGNAFMFNSSYLAGDSGQDLGSTLARWGTVYATNGTINTSDIRIKTNVIPLKYGLNEIVKLQPIRYSMGKKDNKLGFSAQAVSKIIPEVTINCEDDSPIGTAGICPTDLIPVLVNAIKELKEQVDNLSRQINKTVV